MWSTQIPYLRMQFKNQNKFVKIVDGHIGHHHPSYDTQYHVYASNANRHFCYGQHDEKFSGNYWHDITIPPMASVVEDFEYTEDKEDFFLFMARLNLTKGIGIFLDLAKHFPNNNYVLA